MREKAAALVSSCDVRVRAVEAEPRDQYSFERLLRDLAPDLVIQAAALQSPWALIGRDDPVGPRAEHGRPLDPPAVPAALPARGHARGARDRVRGPVANISLPDITHPILDRHGLTPTVGLGNVSMLLVRARATWRARNDDGPAPFLRVVGHHNHVYGVMGSVRRPTPPMVRGCTSARRATRADDLAYGAPPMAPGLRYNHVTAAAALPVLLALLPGAEPLRWSTPAPFGLPGGFPVRIEAGSVELDLPPGVDMDEATEFCRRSRTATASTTSTRTGTVHFTDGAKAIMAPVAPDLTEPLPVDDGEIARRAKRIFDLLA